MLDGVGVPMDGPYAAGELVGGLFFHNYPGGSGPPSAYRLSRS